MVPTVPFKVGFKCQMYKKCIKVWTRNTYLKQRKKKGEKLSRKERVKMLDNQNLCSCIGHWKVEFPNKLEWSGNCCNFCLFVNFFEFCDQNCYNNLRENWMLLLFRDQTVWLGNLEKKKKKKKKIVILSERGEAGNTRVASHAKSYV